MNELGGFKVGDTVKSKSGTWVIERFTPERVSPFGSTIAPGAYCGKTITKKNGTQYHDSKWYFLSQLKKA